MASNNPGPIAPSAFGGYAQKKHNRHPLHLVLFGGFMQELGGAKRRPRNALLGEHKNNDGNSEAIYGRSNAYRFGSLVDAREAYEKHTGLVVNWPNGADEADKPNGLVGTPAGFRHAMREHTYH